MSFAIWRSPCNTLTVTAGWLSAAVENTWLFFVGIVVLRSISFVKTPPSVSIPNESGVTSRSSTSFASPFIIAACVAAPNATHSIGSMPRSIFRLTCSSKNFCTIGILVGPPTMMILSMSEAESPESLNAWSTGPRHLSTIGATSSSRFALFIDMVRCFGPPASAVINGRFISVVMVLESSTFAFSAASRKRCIAILSFFKSMPVSFLNCFAI